MAIRTWALILVLALVAGCALDSTPVSKRPASQPPVPEATYRLTFGLQDTVPTVWDGRLVLSSGQRIQVLPDLLREHNIATGEDPAFPNDYVRTGSSWVVSSRKAWMRDPKAFQLEYPSILVQVWENPSHGTGPDRNRPGRLFLRSPGTPSIFGRRVPGGGCPGRGYSFTAGRRLPVRGTTGLPGDLGCRLG